MLVTRNSSAILCQKTFTGSEYIKYYINRVQCYHKFIVILLKDQISIVFNLYPNILTEVSQESLTEVDFRGNFQQTNDVINGGNLYIYCDTKHIVGCVMTLKAIYFNAIHYDGKL